MFQTVHIDRNTAEAMEWLGTKRKFWFSRGGAKWLFKAEERGTGEDWAEKIACELASKIGIPHVPYELAEEYEGETYLQPGVICPHFAPPRLELKLGNQLLFDRDSDYPKDDPHRYKVKAHTVDAVATCVSQLDLPMREWLKNLPDGLTASLEVFVGYTMLDALIANQDRHHENWGGVRDPSDGMVHLAPSFDHGASLARNVTDEERKQRLESRDVGQKIENFCRRARSGFYLAANDSRSLPTLEAFTEFARLKPDAGERWLKMLQDVTEDEIRAIVSEVPSERMSPIAKEFTTQLILINRGRLLK
jgi:hypothetical protein